MKTKTLAYFITLLLTGSLLLFSNQSKAQMVVDSMFSVPDTGGILPLPPLDTLIAIAKSHSPLLKEQDALIQKNDADTKRVKKSLLDLVKLNTGIQYGNYGDPLVNTLSTGYNMGASIQFSLYQLLGFKNQVQVYNAEKRVSMYKKDEVAMDLEVLVTQLYNNTQGQKAMLKIRGDGSYSAYSHMKMAEKEFAEGTVEVGELSRVTEIYTKAQADYAQCLNDLKNYYMQLEIIVGIPLNSFKQQ